MEHLTHSKVGTLTLTVNVDRRAILDWSTWTVFQAPARGGGSLTILELVFLYLSYCILFHTEGNILLSWMGLEKVSAPVERRMIIFLFSIIVFLLSLTCLLNLSSCLVLLDRSLQTKGRQ